MNKQIKYFLTNTLTLYGGLCCLINLLVFLTACQISSVATEQRIDSTQTFSSTPLVTGAVETGNGQSTVAPGGEKDSSGLPTFKGKPLPLDRDLLFTGSGLCTNCHNSMTDQAGRDVSIDRMWRSSMMANSARDPYWQATVRAEVLHAPHLQEVIEDTCASCHMPMTATSAHAVGKKGVILDDGWLNNAHPAHPLAMDGVSCNLCHQIEADNFGKPESFSGKYLIDFQKPMGERVSYGPFDVSPGHARNMQAASGFAPVRSEHMAKAEMCGVCHNLITPYLDENGQVAGEFPEQMPYSEWLASSYRDSQSCQDCHMPEVEGGVQLSILQSPLRNNFSQHNMVGSNAYMLRILREFGENQQIAASSQDLDTAIQATTDFLQTNTASLSIEGAEISNGKLTASIHVKNLAGHKLPTAYPSRRVWLHIQVITKAGDVIFESGAYRPDGAIIGNDNDLDPARFEPHYLTITDSEQVQIYEAIMINTEGEVTTELLRGMAYIKDNRLLPAGFDKAMVTPDIGVYGEALQDSDFSDAGDKLQISISLNNAEGPFQLKVELLYQSIGFRWAQNLAHYRSAIEVANFLNFYQQVTNLPVVIGSIQFEVK